MVILYSAMALQSELNGRMLEIIRELAGSAFITLPSSSVDFDNPEIARREMEFIWLERVEEAVAAALEPAPAAAGAPTVPQLADAEA